MTETDVAGVAVPADAATLQSEGGRRPRIALVTNGPVGGAEVQLIRLASHLRAVGHPVLVLALLPAPELAARLSDDDIPLVTAPSPRVGRGPVAVAWAAATLRRWRPDAVLAFVYQSVVVARFAARLAGVPVVISSIRNEHIGGRHRERLLGLTDRLADLTVVNAETVGRSLAGRGVIGSSRWCVVPNGIDPAPFAVARGERAAVRQRWAAGDSTFVWLAAGRLVAQKDHASLVAAFARVAEGRDARLVIAGDGLLRPVLEAQVAAAGLGDRVELLGHRTDLPALLAGADALVLSSRWEGQPNVVLEAFTAARPVVATTVGGVPEVVADGENGFLVPPGDTGALARAMAALMDASAAARAAMGRRGRAAAADLEWAVVAPRWSRVIGDRLAVAGMA